MTDYLYVYGNIVVFKRCICCVVSLGDYLYVYGDIDEDGFYNGQLMTGENGLVPSNFIERVMDENGRHLTSNSSNFSKLQQRRCT